MEWPNPKISVAEAPLGEQGARVTYRLEVPPASLSGHVAERGQTDAGHHPLDAARHLPPQPLVCGRRKTSLFGRRFIGWGRPRSCESATSQTTALGTGRGDPDGSLPEINKLSLRQHTNSGRLRRLLARDLSSMCMFYSRLPSVAAVPAASSPYRCHDGGSYEYGDSLSGGL